MGLILATDIGSAQKKHVSNACFCLV